VKWAEVQIDRHQQRLFYPTLDGEIPEDHPVRLIDEMLRGVDWRPWEVKYDGTVGRPPIHPRVMAGVVLYGLTEKITSSRQLEKACGLRLDFMWLAERGFIDHSTISGFRNRFEEALKDLFKQVGHLALRMGLLRLNAMALDGTQIRANSSRHGLATAKTLEGRLQALDEEIEGLFAEMRARDEQESLLDESSGTPAHLPRPLKDAQRRRARLNEALAKAEAAEAKRQSQQAAAKGQQERGAKPGVGDTDGPPSGGDDSPDVDERVASADVEAPAEPPAVPGDPASERAPRVPVADPDATLLPNKEGGFAPNYTVLVAADGEHGLLLDVAVIVDNDEGAHALETVDHVVERFGEVPGQFLGDGAYGSGANLSGLAERDVEGFIPQTQREDRPDNPARRPDPTQAVAEADWPRLPRSRRTKKLDRSAFMYDAEADCYWCPLGQRLWCSHRNDRHRRRERVVSWLYRARSCSGCPLAGVCLNGEGNRTISRDEYEDLREAMDERLGSERGKATYRQRSWMAETPNAVIKGWMGVRQFLTRGVAKVTTELWWVATAFNLKKMVHLISAMRERLWALAV